MPGGDGTGPIGRGPMTGRAAGLCAGYPIPGYTTSGYGRGYGRGWGRGSGRGYWSRGRGFWWKGHNPELYHLPIKTTEEEKTYLENIIKGLEEEIHSIKERIKELSKENL